MIREALLCDNQYSGSVAEAYRYRKRESAGEKNMELKAYTRSDADTILSWSNNERSFFQWTAGVMGDYPITPEEFRFVEALTAFTAYDGKERVGFFTLRRPDGSVDELRIGFVIIDPEKRGKGFGKEMLKLGIRYAFEECGAKTVSLGVFENNPAAYHCYRAAGFEEVKTAEPEEYDVLGEKWKCIEMRIAKAP